MTRGVRPKAEGTTTPGRESDLSSRPVEVILNPWEEVTGTVGEVVTVGNGLRVTLETPDGRAVLILGKQPRGPNRLTRGARVAILRTDDPAREYVVRRIA